VHIVHVTEALGAGTAEHLIVATRASLRRGDRATIVYSERPELSPGWQLRIEPRVELLQSPVPLRPSPWLVGHLQALARFLGGLGADLIHFHGSYAGFTGRLACRDDVLTAYTPHGFAFLRRDLLPITRAMTWLGERAAGRFGTLLACSPSEASLAERVAYRVRTVPNGIADHPLFALEPDPGPDDLVVGCGRLAPQKDPLAFVRIAAGIAVARGRPVRALWIGEGVLRQRVGDLARKLGVRLTITGWQDREAGLELLRGAGVVLYPARWDGLPLTLLEAAALGRAIVARDTPAARDATGATPGDRPRSDEPSAYLVRGEAEAISRASALLRQPDQRMRLGRAARVHWQEHFTEDRFARRLTDTYEALTGEARIRSAAE
jgi:glycosyltransferase involved in cell wall biosynthesis